MKRASLSDWWEAVEDNDYQAKQIETLRQADAKEIVRLNRIIKGLTEACKIAFNALDGDDRSARMIARGIVKNALESLDGKQ